VSLLDIVLHLDVHLIQLVKDYGVWIYGILFAIIFSETGSSCCSPPPRSSATR